MTSRVWTGFTEQEQDDINNDITKERLHHGQTAQRQRTDIRQARLQGGGKAPSREKLGNIKITKTPHNYTPIPPQARLSQSKEQESSSPTPPSGCRSLDSSERSSPQPPSPVPPSPCKSPTGSHAKSVKIRLHDNNSYEVIPTNGTTEQDQTEEVKAETESLLVDSICSEDGVKEGGDETTLERFQKRQKMMEEQNKRRKELLAKAIADRSRRTQSEAKKLKQIQTELARLDSLLSGDVSLLRDQIETASLEFNDAQKRYDKAEKEFIEAKLQLFGKLEKKELLTEHLCRIIEANELRKANKLSELMAKLEMVDISSEVSDTESGEVLPHLACLDEITYAACTTLKDPKRVRSGLETNVIKPICDSVKECAKDKVELHVEQVSREISVLEKQSKGLNDSEKDHDTRGETELTCDSKEECRHEDRKERIDAGKTKEGEKSNRETLELQSENEKDRTEDECEEELQQQQQQQQEKQVDD